MGWVFTKFVQKKIKKNSVLYFSITTIIDIVELLDYKDIDVKSTRDEFWDSTDGTWVIFYRYKFRSSFSFPPSSIWTEKIFLRFIRVLVRNTWKYTHVELQVLTKYNERDFRYFRHSYSELKDPRYQSSTLFVF